MAQGSETKRKGPLDLTRIVQDVEGLWSDWQAWLHRESGEVYFLTESEGDDDEAEAEIEELIAAGKLIPIDRDPWDDHRRAERFIRGLGDGDDANRIASAWNRRGRGRWSRFKGALHAAGLLKEWDDYRSDCVRADVIRLLEMEGIAFREEAGPPSR